MKYMVYRMLYTYIKIQLLCFLLLLFTNFPIGGWQVKFLWPKIKVIYNFVYLFTNWFTRDCNNDLKLMLNDFTFLCNIFHIFLNKSNFVYCLRQRRTSSNLHILHFYLKIYPSGAREFFYIYYYYLFIYFCKCFYMNNRWGSLKMRKI